MGNDPLSSDLGDLEERVERRLAELDAGRIVQRIWERDHTVWRDDPSEISDRLGWLDAPARARETIRDLGRFAADVAEDGVSDALLLGMGGSSLAPEVLGRAFGPRTGIRLAVLDTTHPDAIADLERRTDLDRTLFIVASKSGTTIETRSHMAYFLDRTGDPSRFVAITDPGTQLERDAHEAGFRAVFSAPADVGGRYSALTPFGLVPGALIGADLERLIDGADAASRACREPDGARNPGLWLGAVLGEAVLAGRDKATMVGPSRAPDPGASGSLDALGAWAEQLFAESTGKEGTGIVPVDGESLGPADAYGDDRLFLAIGDGAAPAPSVALPWDEPEDLGGAFFTLEFATAVAGHVLGIHPFDQPDVQEAKDRTGEVLSRGEIPAETIAPVEEALGAVRPGDYVAIQAFVPSRHEVLDALGTARLRARDRLRVATTLGLGPRYLHSTGQLHKGGPDTGVFLQVFADPAEDREVPGQPFGFGRLIAAQAAGDLAALRARRRRAARVRLDELLAWGA